MMFYCLLVCVYSISAQPAVNTCGHLWGGTWAAGDGGERLNVLPVQKSKQNK